MVSHHAALIYTMVLVSAADRDMTDEELRAIGQIVSFLPAFQGFDPSELTRVTQSCAELLEDEDGLDKALEAIRAALPSSVVETAYCLACDVATADRSLGIEERRLLELLREALGIDRLVAAAIERAAAARYATIG